MYSAAMNLFGNWIEGDSVADGMAILSLAVTIGLFVGAISFRRMKLGISGVLFSALLFGQIGLTIDPKVLQFLRDFALILFMYAIGLQVGPGFISSLRTEGLRLNLLAVAVLVLGAAMSAAPSAAQPPPASTPAHSPPRQASPPLRKPSADLPPPVTQSAPQPPEPDSDTPSLTPSASSGPCWSSSSCDEYSASTCKMRKAR